MLQMVILVLARTEHLDAVVEAWHDEGVDDVTVFQSMGQAQLRDRCRRDDLPLFPSMRDILESEQFDHYTLFAITDSDALIDRLIAVTERQIGPLEAKNNGILLTVPIGRVRGLRARA
jgi:hypothetical protein